MSLDQCVCRCVLHAVRYRCSADIGRSKMADKVNGGGGGGGDPVELSPSTVVSAGVLDDDVCVTRSVDHLMQGPLVAWVSDAHLCGDRVTRPCNRLVSLSLSLCADPDVSRRRARLGLRRSSQRRLPRRRLFSHVSQRRRRFPSSPPLTPRLGDPDGNQSRKTTR